MNTPKWSPTEIIRNVGSGVLYVETENQNKRNIGTAFYIGDNWCITARHVVDGKTINRIGRNDVSLMTQFFSSNKPQKTTFSPAKETSEIGKIIYHPDDKIDLAAIEIPKFHRDDPHVLLNLWNSSCAENEFLLHEVLVLGYPPIPFSKKPYLVCLRVQIAAVIVHYGANKRHFVLSGMARGGFSGGVALSLNHPYATFGVITESLVKDEMPVELGFLSVLSADAVNEMLLHHKIETRAVRDSRSVLQRKIES